MYIVVFAVCAVIACSYNFEFIYINALTALVVPKRSFSSDASFEEFADTAKAYHSKAWA